VYKKILAPTLDAPGFTQMKIWWQWEQNIFCSLKLKRKKQGTQNMRKQKEESSLLLCITAVIVIRVVGRSVYNRFS